MKQIVNILAAASCALFLFSCGDSKDSNETYQTANYAYSTPNDSNEVCITPHGKRYHHSWCRTIQGHSVTFLSEEAAEMRGRTPCHVCY